MSLPPPITDKEQLISALHYIHEKTKPNTRPTYEDISNSIGDEKTLLQLQNYIKTLNIPSFIWQNSVKLPRLEHDDYAAEYISSNTINNTYNEYLMNTIHDHLVKNEFIDNVLIIFTYIDTTEKLKVIDEYIKNNVELGKNINKFIKLLRNNTKLIKIYNSTTAQENIAHTIYKMLAEYDDDLNINETETKKTLTGIIEHILKKSSLVSGGAKKKTKSKSNKNKKTKSKSRNKKTNSNRNKKTNSKSNRKYKNDNY